MADNFHRQLYIYLLTVTNDDTNNYPLTDLNYKSPCVTISNRIATQMIVTWAITCIGFLFTGLHSQFEGVQNEGDPAPRRGQYTPTPGKTAGKFLCGWAINPVNTVSYRPDSKSAVDGYSLLTSQKYRKTRLDNRRSLGVFLGVSEKQRPEKEQHYQTLRQWVRVLLQHSNWGYNPRQVAGIVYQGSQHYSHRLHSYSIGSYTGNSEKGTSEGCDSHLCDSKRTSVIVCLIIFRRCWPDQRGRV